MNSKLELPLRINFSAHDNTVTGLIVDRNNNVLFDIADERFVEAEEIVELINSMPDAENFKDKIEDLQSQVRDAITELEDLRARIGMRAVTEAEKVKPPEVHRD